MVKHQWLRRIAEMSLHAAGMRLLGVHAVEDVGRAQVLARFFAAVALMPIVHTWQDLLTSSAVVVMETVHGQLALGHLARDGVVHKLEMWRVILDWMLIAMQLCHLQKHRCAQPTHALTECMESCSAPFVLSSSLIHMLMTRWMRSRLLSRRLLQPCFAYLQVQSQCSQTKPEDCHQSWAAYNLQSGVGLLPEWRQALVWRSEAQAKGLSASCRPQLVRRSSLEA
mmetsp:Transcript_17874/g.41451  ORF Transcript_17874/g.41451 Transcript_17874/m.41451 type:complete len:225 (-) Transcript_17874:1050-1724(-)